MTKAIIIDREQEATRNSVPVSRSMRAAAHFNHPEHRTFTFVAICGQQGVRARAAGLVFPFETGTRALNPEIRLPAIHFPIRRLLPADTGALIAVLPADRLRFNLSRLRLPGSLIPSLRVQPAKQSRGGFTQSFRSFLSAVFHDRNSNTGPRAWRAEKLSLSSRNWSVRS